MGTRLGRAWLNPPDHPRFCDLDLSSIGPGVRASATPASSGRGPLRRCRAQSRDEFVTFVAAEALGSPIGAASRARCQHFVSGRCGSRPNSLMHPSDEW